MANRLPPIVCFSTEDWDTPLPTNKKQLMQRLARPDAPVVWIDTVGTRLPRLTPADLRRVMNRLKSGAGRDAATTAHPGLIRVSPLVIPGGPVKLNRAILGRRLRKVFDQLRLTKYILWIYNPYAADYGPALPSPPSLTVYHCVDDLSLVPGARGAAIKRAERRVLKQADLVFCTSPALMDRCQPHNEACVYAPNVADFEHFHRAAQPGAQPPAVITRIPRPRLVFAGNLVDYKIDFDLLTDCARCNPAWQFVLIGPEWPGNPDEALTVLKALPNVHFTGAAPYAELPDYLAAADVLLMPYRLGPRTETIFPLKFYEFLATGLPVVSTALPSLREHAALVPMTERADAFAGAIEDALNGAQNSRRAERLDLARANTWSMRLESMTREIQNALARLHPST